MIHSIRIVVRVIYTYVDCIRISINICVHYTYLDVFFNYYKRTWFRPTTFRLGGFKVSGFEAKAFRFGLIKFRLLGFMLLECRVLALGF